MLTKARTFQKYLTTAGVQLNSRECFIYRETQIKSSPQLSLLIQLPEDLIRKFPEAKPPLVLIFPYQSSQTILNLENSKNCNKQLTFKFLQTFYQLARFIFCYYCTLQSECVIPKHQVPLFQFI